MATKNNTAKKKKAEKTVMIKIAEKVGELAARVVNEKEHLVAMAGNAVNSVKATIQKATAEKNLPNKKASTPVRRKAAKKIAGPVSKKAGKAVKKAAPAKKATKKKSAKKR